MLKQFIRKIKRQLDSPIYFSGKYQDINPEDIFLDSTNLPGFEEHRFEGRIEKPMGQKTFFAMKIILTVIILALVSKLWVLGIKQGNIYTQISENNRLEQTLIFANRGLIYDRNMLELANNAIKKVDGAFAGRYYVPIKGLAHTVGYLKYPLSDKSGIYYEENYRGRDGVERAFNDLLSGTNGLKLRETDVFGNITSESVIEKPKDGSPIVLSIDAYLTEALHKAIGSLAKDKGFVGGAGVLMDVNTGEILAMTSFPEYDQNILTNGTDRETINLWVNNSSKVFLNRTIGGLYTPGSILKPIVALAALNEKIISPTKKILSTGSIIVPNPYDPSKPSIFKDWKAHGWTNMREALAVSSDTYFYSIGGGYEDQKGLGISSLDKYFQIFSLTEKTGIELSGEVEGVIPTPEWKKEKFDGEIWRLGDTYITAIGQYGTQVTPLNAARFIAVIANGGRVLTPSLLKGGNPKSVEHLVEFDNADWEIVREGMREGVTYGTSVGLNVPYVKMAAKTGTAEVGSAKLYVNSWSVGFFPFEHPRFAWAVVMERGPSLNTFGATFVVRQLFDWMAVNTPEYFE
ncbi:MAG: Penicillin-binding protein [Parcubacteria group bacterium GW2011_GWB1_38_8]|nr:MAG: Penicillin-binding protein [Parcubacteria group bacterium GW2011_GWB1_38_8]KKR29753.1 MAG: Penicillin-binding protein [Parcubacteria group bacterium GW2011_GWC1_39_8]